MKTQFRYNIFILFVLFFLLSSCHTYIVPSSQLDGSVHVVQNNRLRFNYFENFQSTSLKYSIFDNSRTVVIDNVVQPITIHYGLNQINLNVGSIVNGTDKFIMEIAGPKGDKKIIRFR